MDNIIICLKNNQNININKYNINIVDNEYRTILIWAIINK